MSAAVEQLAGDVVVKKLSRRQASVAAEFKRWQKTKARAKALYDRADRILSQMATVLEVGVPSPINTAGKHVVLRDNFAGKEIVWGHGGVRHWDLETIDLSK
jgi:hypothetical protein